MIDREENDNRVSYPPIFSVHLPKELKDVGARAFISNFSIPDGIPLPKDDKGDDITLRGIANIGFSYPKDLSDVQVTIQVYVQSDKENIYALKYDEAKNGPAWTPITVGELVPGAIGPYIGHRTGKFKIGDPPIAVG